MVTTGTSDLLSVAEVLPDIWRTGAPMTSKPYEISTNAYAIVGDGSSLLIDSAWWLEVPAMHLDELLDILEQRGAPATGVFLTHAHRDHSGFAGYLTQRLAPGAAVLLHDRERPTVDAMTDYQGLPDRDAAVQWYLSMGFPVDRAASIVDTKMPDRPMSASALEWCAEGQELEVGGRRLRVVGTPGHTPGHAALFEDATGVLFSGDALLPRGHGNPHVTVRPFTSPDPLTDYIAGLEALRGLGARVCLPGHGPVVQDPAALIDAHLAYVETKMTAVRAALTAEPQTPFEIASRIAWRGGRKRFADLVNDEWFLAFGDALARIRRAETMGCAVSEDHVDGVRRYRAA